jgi:hypothetical protein
MLQREDELGNIKPGPLLAESRLLLQMPEQFSSALEISHEVQVSVGLEAELESDEERRVQGTLQNLALPDGVCDFLLCDDFFLGKDLHRIYPFRILLSHLEDLAEGPSAD